ncbi:hypothetical protein Bca52824_033196 [Brassica carinata]|uniref:Uncharacterized protein n=1 Tax=Brassica carinata TaxID=52824 RepID=A0A8X7V5V1_BRACI|nr:hypothetical protein Bca52824_033196 [Brassica carinata]
MALKETTTRTALEKTSDVSEATIEATNSSGMRKSDHIEAGPAALVSRSGGNSGGNSVELEDDEADDGEEKSGSSDEDNEVDDGQEKSNASDEDDEGEEKSAASDENDEGEENSATSDKEDEGEESEEEVGEKGVANNVEESVMRP